jgi:two-component system sensor histidine kinase NreB
VEHGIQLRFASRDVPYRLPGMVALALFRVAQEAADNALTHAGAAAIEVSIVAAAGAIELEIVDEGRGFDLEDALRTHAVGLVEMRERMRAIGGTCVVTSRPGAGTRVQARVALSLTSPQSSGRPEDL